MNGAMPALASALSFPERMVSTTQGLSMIAALMEPSFGFSRQGTAESCFM
jgi:hypothetical protein